MIRLNDEHRESIREHFPEESIPDGRPGAEPIPARRVLEAVLRILDTGARWHRLPQCHPNHEAVHRRFQDLCRNGLLANVLTDLADTLRDEGTLDETESLIDAVFASAGCGGAGPPRVGMGGARVECRTTARRRETKWRLPGTRPRLGPRSRRSRGSRRSGASGR